MFPRSAKSIPLIAAGAARCWTSRPSALTPSELVNAILKAPVELIYNGGIGTYVKARTEATPRWATRPTTPCASTARSCGSRCWARAPTWACTQAGRIEFAQAGGRINTDAIDNSAGVDSSDHEVNIKILTGILERGGELTRESRNALLPTMTDDVASHVLADNYDQTLALSLMESHAVAEL